MSAADKGTLIKNGLSELSKAYYVYDASDRPISIYVAAVDAVNGDPCLLTTFTYVGLQALVEKFNETESIWLTAYDI